MSKSKAEPDKPKMNRSELLSLIKPGYVSKAIYLLCNDSSAVVENDPYTEFLRGLALCNARVEVYRLRKYCSVDATCIERLGSGFSGAQPPYADPQMLCWAHRHFHKARLLNFQPESWLESYALKQQTAELLLDFIVAEQKDPHMFYLKVPDTPFRVVQVSYLCLSHLAFQFVPSEHSRANAYTTFLSSAREYESQSA